MATMLRRQKIPSCTPVDHLLYTARSTIPLLLRALKFKAELRLPPTTQTQNDNTEHSKRNAAPKLTDESHVMGIPDALSLLFGLLFLYTTMTNML